MLLIWWGLSTVILASVYSSFILATSLDQNFKFPFEPNKPHTLADCLERRQCRLAAEQRRAESRVEGAFGYQDGVQRGDVGFLQTGGGQPSSSPLRCHPKLQPNLLFQLVCSSSPFSLSEENHIYEPKSI